MKPTTSSGKEYGPVHTGTIVDFKPERTLDGLWILVLCDGKPPFAIDNRKAKFTDGDVAALRARYVGWYLRAPVSSYGKKWVFAKYASKWRKKFPASRPGRPEIPEMDDDELKVRLREIVLQGFAEAAHWDESRVQGASLAGDEASDRMKDLLEWHGRDLNNIGGTWIGMANAGLILNIGDKSADRPERNRGHVDVWVLLDKGVQAVVDFIRRAKPMRPVVPESTVDTAAKEASREASRRTGERYALRPPASPWPEP